MVTVELSDGRSIELLEAVRTQPRELGLGAYHEGELVGLLVCEADAVRNGHLTVFVKPAWRGVGVGTSLIGRMAERAAAFDLVFLTISYTTDNVAAAQMLDATGLVLARRVRDGVEKVALLVPGASAVLARPTPTAAAAA